MKYSLVFLDPQSKEFFFIEEVPDGYSYDDACRAALSAKLSLPTDQRIFCLGVVPHRTGDVQTEDIIQALSWSEALRRWRRQRLEAAPDELFVQILVPPEMSYDHCLGSDVPEEASWRPVYHRPEGE